MNLLLDTCALLWLVDRPSRLPAAVKKQLTSPSARVHVSALTAWELGIKMAKGKLLLPAAVSQWFPQVVARYRLLEVGISAVICASSTELPLIHADPFDRLLIATAHAHDLTLVTADSIIPTYPGVRTLW
jgi:PIN domain nuclease of toxin-antitoxin system